MLSFELTSRCSCYAVRQYFAVKRVQCPPDSSAIFTFKQPKQLNLVPRFPRPSVQYDGSISQIIETMTSFWRHGFIMTVKQLVMVNYACAFSQSESGKYFERIIIEFNDSDVSAVAILYSRKKNSPASAICWTLRRVFETHPDPSISDDVCCYSQSRFDPQRLKNCSID